MKTHSYNEVIIRQTCQHWVLHVLEHYPTRRQIHQVHVSAVAKDEIQTIACQKRRCSLTAATSSPHSMPWKYLPEFIFIRLFCIHLSSFHHGSAVDFAILPKMRTYATPQTWTTCRTKLSAASAWRLQSHAIWREIWPWPFIPTLRMCLLLSNPQGWEPPVLRITGVEVHLYNDKLAKGNIESLVFIRLRAIHEEVKSVLYSYILKTTDEATESLGDIFNSGFYPWGFPAIFFISPEKHKPSPVGQTLHITMDYPSVSTMCPPGVTLEFPQSVPQVLAVSVLLNWSCTAP